MRVFVCVYLQLIVQRKEIIDMRKGRKYHHRVHMKNCEKLRRRRAGNRCPGSDYGLRHKVSPFLSLYINMRKAWEQLHVVRKDRSLEIENDRDRLRGVRYQHRG